MKKILIIVICAVIVLPVIAEDTPTTLYGKFRLDYDLAQEDAESDPATLGGFNVARARMGVVWSMTDVLTGKIEVDAYDYALRIAEAKWAVTDTFEFGVGRMYEVFAPNSEWHATRFDGIGGTYDTGSASLALQIGNTKSASPTGLSFMPAVVVSPDMGDTDLEAGVNARLITPYYDSALAAEIDAEGFMNAYADAGIGALGLLVNFDYNKFMDSDATHMDINSDLNYGLGKVTPGVCMYLIDLSSNTMDMVASTEIYATFDLTDKLTSKFAVALANVNEANGGEMEYAVTLRFEFNPKYSF